MFANSRWSLSEETKDELIDLLTPELITLRMKAGISQGELSNLIGISRQTYGAIERHAKRMTWSTYLSLIMFYDRNQNTHQILRAIGAFPEAISKFFNEAPPAEDADSYDFLGQDMKQLLECLDEQAMHSIKSLIMIEYARCKKLPGEVVVKSFDGMSFSGAPVPSAIGKQALKSIKDRRCYDDN